MSIVPPYRLSPDEEARLLERLLSAPAIGGVSTPTSGSIVKTASGYLFQDIEYAPGKTEHLELLGLISDKNGKPLTKQHADWIVSTQNTGVRLPTSREWYQLLHRLYTNRNTPGLQAVVAECIDGIREDFQKYWIFSGTGIVYNEAQGTIIHHDGSGTSKSIVIPEFTRNLDTAYWTYLELASKQTAGNLGTTNAIPTGAHPVLEALFGSGYQDVGAVFQYASKPLDDGNLRKVWFCTETARGRAEYPLRALVLGVNGSHKFIIDANGNINNNRPARGVVVRENFP